MNIDPLLFIQHWFRQIKLFALKFGLLSVTIDQSSAELTAFVRRLYLANLAT